MYFISHDIFLHRKNLSQKGKVGCKKGLLTNTPGLHWGFLAKQCLSYCILQVIYRICERSQDNSPMDHSKCVLAWITTISVPPVGRKVPKHDFKRTDRMNLTMNLQEPASLEPENIKKIVAKRTWSKLSGLLNRKQRGSEREREMSERGSKAWLNQIPKTSAINGTAPGLLSIKKELHHFGPAEMDIPRLTKEIPNKLVACNQIHVSLQHHHRLYQHQHCLLFLLHDNHRP